jgi:hypothetical protein
VGDSDHPGRRRPGFPGGAEGPLVVRFALGCRQRRALTGLAVWWIGRRWFALAAIIIFGLVLILLEDLPDLGDIGDTGGGSAKEQRRVKLERAIARRQALLAQMDGHRS